MSQKVANSPLGSFLVAVDSILGSLFQKVKLTFGVDGVATDVSALNPLPVSATFAGIVSPLAKVDAVNFQDIVGIADASTSVLAANPDRSAGWVRNLTDLNMFVSFSGTAVAGKPTKLYPREVLQLVNAGCVYTGAVSAIHEETGLTLNLEVVEL